MSDAATSSIRKRIVDLCLSRLNGTTDAPLPSWLGDVTVNKSRSVPIGRDEIANKTIYSVYFANDNPAPVGDPRRPTITNRKLMIEVRIIVKGDDDTADPHCVWVTQQVVSADRCTDTDGTQLALSLTEAETEFGVLEGSQGEVLETRIRFIVEYKTNPRDITKVN